MDTAAPILLVDDGELDRVQEILQRLGLEWARCLEPDPERLFERPRNLLITSGPRAMRMPPLPGEGEPLWVCVYDQDFLPIRDRLRDLGVHYLVSGEVHGGTFAVFLRQLLYAEGERRSQRRIPLSAEVSLDVGFERRRALLVDLSFESCALITPQQIPTERRVRVHLPEALTGRGPLALECKVGRAWGRPSLDGPGGVTTVLRWVDLDAEMLAKLGGLFSGDAPGTQVTPLAPEPCWLEEMAWDDGVLVHGSGLDAAGPLEPDRERRTTSRVPLPGRVEAIRGAGLSAPVPTLGLDLSRGGIRVAITPEPAIGSVLSLAIYSGDAREEPLLADASVIRSEDGEAALEFGPLASDQRVRLERILDSKPSIERLAGAGSVMHVAQVRGRPDPV